MAEDPVQQVEHRTETTDSTDHAVVEAQAKEQQELNQREQNDAIQVLVNKGYSEEDARVIVTREGAHNLLNNLDRQKAYDRESNYVLQAKPLYQLECSCGFVGTSTEKKCPNCGSTTDTPVEHPPQEDDTPRKRRNR